MPGGNLYNLVFGTGEWASLVLFLLELDEADFGRFRDAWIELDGGSVLLAVHTRCGSGNRPHYEHVFTRMAAHPLFVRERDNDDTYATFFFRPPADAVDRINAAAAEHGQKLEEGWTLQKIAVPPVDLRARWDAATQDLLRQGPTPAKS